MKQNRMKAKLIAGEPTIGVSIMIPSPQIVEMVAKLGFDWILIDCEHGTISLETVEMLAMAAETGGVTPIARPKTKTAGDILDMMERGVMGVQVPHVNSAEDARRVVEAVKSVGRLVLEKLAARRKNHLLQHEVEQLSENLAAYFQTKLGTKIVYKINRKQMLRPK